MADGADIKVTGLVDLVAQLKGSAFKHVNQELRPMARGIADEIRPHVELMVRLSRAPQAAAMSRTVRTKPDRVPVIVVGKVNPKFQSHKFARPGQDSKERRGSLAHGVIYGPKGGKRNTPADENYYAPLQRDDNGGAFGKSVREGAIFEQATQAYLDAFMSILTHHGFIKDGNRGVHWGGGGR